MEGKNIALRLSYTGTAYHGWQVQKNAASVAETLEKALASVVGHPVKVTGRAAPTPASTPGCMWPISAPPRASRWSGCPWR